MGNLLSVRLAAMPNVRISGTGFAQSRGLVDGPRQTSGSAEIRPAASEHRSAKRPAATRVEPSRMARPSDGEILGASGEANSVRLQDAMVTGSHRAGVTAANSAVPVDVVHAQAGASACSARRWSSCAGSTSARQRMRATRTTSPTLGSIGGEAQT